MGKHIQGPDGKMKGSIGSGKTKVPTAAAAKSKVTKPRQPKPEPAYAEMLSAYQAAAESPHPRVRCEDLQIGDIVLVRNPYSYEPVEITKIASHRFQDRWLIRVKTAAGEQNRWVSRAGSMQILHRPDDDSV
jgi:hypothetical protein